VWNGSKVLQVVEEIAANQDRSQEKEETPSARQLEITNPLNSFVRPPRTNPVFGGLRIFGAWHTHHGYEFMAKKQQFGAKKVELPANAPF